MSPRSNTLAVVFILFSLPAAQAQVSKEAPAEPQKEATKDTAPNTAPVTQKPKRVVKSEAEWAKLLTRDQFLVTRRKSTEPAFSGKLLHNKAKGVYVCTCCESPLFVSRTKFDSGTGWPSFYAPYTPGSVVEEADHSYGQTRVEVLCSTCDAHLGHVFDDGPRPTFLRYCMNSLSLKFVKDSPATATSTPKKGAASKAESGDTPARREAPAANPPSE